MGQVKNQRLDEEFGRSLVLAGSRINAEPVEATTGEGGNDNISPVADILATGIRNKLPNADDVIFGKQNENR